MKERVERYGKGEEAFKADQKLINMYDSLKDGFAVRGECIKTLKTVLNGLYGTNFNGDYKIPLHALEEDVDRSGTLGPPPQKVSFLRIKNRKNEEFIKEDRLPGYVKHLMQDSGYQPKTIQPSGSIVLLCYSEFDPATRETKDVQHFGPPIHESFVLKKELLEYLGLTNTEITCSTVNTTPTYSLAIVGTGYRVDETVTIPGGFTQNKYFLGNKEKNDAINELCSTNGSDLEINKYAISKLLGDKLQVVGTLMYMLANKDKANYDDVCLFTTDNVVAMLCRILGVSCCLQDHGDEEDRDEGKEKGLKIAKIVYYPTAIDPVKLLKAQIDLELNMCIAHNTKIQNDLAKCIAEASLYVGSTLIERKEPMMGFLREIINKIIEINNTLITNIPTTLEEAKKICNKNKVLVLVSPIAKGFKALQSASKVSLLADDPITRTKTSFGVHLLTLSGENDYAKEYRTKRIRGGGNESMETVTDEFLQAAREVLPLLREKLNGILDTIDLRYTATPPTGESRQQSLPPTPPRTSVSGSAGRTPDRPSGSGTVSFSPTPDRPAAPQTEERLPRSVSFQSVIPNPQFDSVPMTLEPSGYGSASLAMSASLDPSASLVKSEVQGSQGVKRGRNGKPLTSSELLAAQSIASLSYRGGSYTLKANAEYDTLNNMVKNDISYITAVDFCLSGENANDEYDILYLLYSYLTYIGDTPLSPELIEFLVVELIKRPNMTLEEFEEIYTNNILSHIETVAIHALASLKGGRRTRKRKLKGILKSRKKQASSRSKRQTRR
jgi:hypothetical protein